jgi:hypothetical protein
LPFVLRDPHDWVSVGAATLWHVPLLHCIWLQLRD